MQNWFTVFRYELPIHLLRRSYLLFTFGVPLLVVVAFLGYRFYEAQRAEDDPTAQDQNEIQTNFGDAGPVGYFDPTGLFPAPPEGSPFFGLVEAYPSPAAGRAALEAEEIDQFFVIAPDYVESGEVTQYINRLSLSVLETDVIRSFLLVSLVEGMEPGLVNRLLSPVLRFDQQTLGTDGAEQATSEGADFIKIYAFAILMFITVYGTSGYLMYSVVGEKEANMIEIILTSVQPFPLLVGKVLATGVTGLVFLLAWGGALFFIVREGSAAFDALAGIEVEPAVLAIALVYFVLGYALVGSLFAALGAVISTVREGSTLAGFLVLPVLAPLFFITEMVNNPDGALAVGLSLFPITAPLAMVMRATVTDVPLGELLVSVALTTLAVVGAIWLAGRLFRVNTLLRGSVNPRQVLRYLLSG
ncbi:MAG: ABC transporter permease [Anaerolineae bacterium]|nr:ABC transporter permease [Anaerolineae bacterium]